MIRKATGKDIAAVAEIYDAILKEEETGNSTIGWLRGVYPTEQTALAALEKGTLFVLEDEGRIVAAAKIDGEQVPEYADCQWRYPVSENRVMVLHTLVVAPECPRRGYGREFVRFYEEYAAQNGRPYLRIDTNVKNAVARKMYRTLGYEEIGEVSCTFNGISQVQLVCMEKKV